MNKWDENYELVNQYYKHNGNVRIPIDFKTINGFEPDNNGRNIGLWLLMQNKKSLDNEQIEKLKNVGWSFNSNDDKNKKVGAKSVLLNLLVRKIKSGVLINSDDLYDFVLKVNKAEVPRSLYLYVYNYLYRKNDLSKMYLKYRNNKLYLFEYYENGDFSYLTIQPSDEISDIKRETVMVRKDNDGYKAMKTLAYTTDAAIDLVIFNTDEDDFVDYKLDQIINSEIKRNDYIKVALFKNGEYPLYDVIDIGKMTDVYEGIIKDDIIHRFDRAVDKIRRENLTLYSKSQLRDFEELNSSKYSRDYNVVLNSIMMNIEDNNDYKYTSDNELLSNNEMLQFIKRMDITNENGRGVRSRQR